jgi:transcriptional regulator with XRE-family HTH domain
MPDSPHQDWYLKEWARLLGKKQADAVRDLGWDKSTTSFIWNGKQPYRRDHVNRLADWLGIRPFELLMPPAEAIALRRLRETAAEIVARSLDV